MSKDASTYIPVTHQLPPIGVVVIAKNAAGQTAQFREPYAAKRTGTGKWVNPRTGGFTNPTHWAPEPAMPGGGGE